ncbi:MAG: NUDIX domain-containing protein [Chloroflexi bacterium]|nr:NUDIX domain-containing protein [Chloroflexota bacterium]
MATEFRFCPICATPLQSIHRYDRVRLGCPACGFVHFADPKVAVIALVIADGAVLLVRRAVDPGKGLWSLPGGYMDAGEMPAEALQREVREEVGLAIDVGEMSAIFPMQNGAGKRVGIVLAFRAQPSGLNRQVYAQDDVSEAGWFGPRQIPPDLAFDSTKTLIAEWARSEENAETDT